MTAASYVRSYDSGAVDYIEDLDGVPWSEAAPPDKRHECWAQTRGLMNGSYVERCACGSFGPAPFFMLGRDTPRVHEARGIRKLMAMLAHSPP